VTVPDHPIHWPNLQRFIRTRLKQCQQFNRRLQWPECWPKSKREW
jgi:hypothetical protein